MPLISPRAPDGTEDAAIGLLMYDAIHRGRSLYTAAQRHAWLPEPNAGPDWTARLARQEVLLARDDAALLGVMTRGGDYIDLAYVAPQAQGRGVFRALYAALERGAEGQPRLWTHASLMAQPAFAAVGFGVVRHETVARAGQDLKRAEMEKRLA